MEKEKNKKKAKILGIIYLVSNVVLYVVSGVRWLMGRLEGSLPTEAHSWYEVFIVAVAAFYFLPMVTGIFHYSKLADHRALKVFSGIMIAVYVYISLVGVISLIFWGVQ